MAAIQASQVHWSPQHMGLARIDESPSGSIEAANELLQKNHDKYHMYFREVAGHNHIPHSVLSVLAMGGGPSELKRVYDDGESLQLPLPPLDRQVVKELSEPKKFWATMLSCPNIRTSCASSSRKWEPRAGRPSLANTASAARPSPKPALPAVRRPFPPHHPPRLRCRVRAE